MWQPPSYKGQAVNSHLLNFIAAKSVGLWSYQQRVHCTKFLKLTSTIPMWSIGCALSVFYSILCSVFHDPLHQSQYTTVYYSIPLLWLHLSSLTRGNKHYHKDNPLMGNQTLLTTENVPFLLSSGGSQKWSVIPTEIENWASLGGKQGSKQL